MARPLVPAPVSPAFKFCCRQAEVLSHLAGTARLSSCVRVSVRVRACLSCRSPTHSCPQRDGRRFSLHDKRTRPETRTKHANTPYTIHRTYIYIVHTSSMHICTCSTRYKVRRATMLYVRTGVLDYIEQERQSSSSYRSAILVYSYGSS